ncbi:putative carbon-monoxide dehydrogenase large subunit [Tolypothrix tenuis PCC 7101]|uniref:Putative carbon-monoxide dehydrogenase large subunit n=1 Tax=Tolypothrix tenuis PCC 7101 TaxID=231146 RepID=A0A1Z4MVA3_9CYAN|nr:molybdopterin-dependent oxidoreductase [Aulosira sp. FACHB-113]BAY97353.1 putative carbon-monoxide dehydrogenase large subunit [Tolypothrix tenuis PCC 7101]BAZ72138.1 putative carbon-monoxide dehydrogenase large subunit [Aulosira laxa NIES-50]
MAQPILGTSIKRREDPELLRGEAKFTADITLPNMLHMAILHSTEAHALIKSIDTSVAEKMPGVVRVITGADTSAIFPLPVIMNPGGAEAKFPPHPYGIPAGQTILAINKVRYVGDFVAVVVAQTRQQAYDALKGIKVEYEPLPVVTDAEEALQPNAPQLYDNIPGNLNQYASYGDKEATEKAIASAEVIIKQKIRIPRVIANSSETRATIADYNPETGDYTLWTNTQIPHGNRFLLSQLVLGIPFNKLRVIVPHMGGSYGSKGYLYQDTAITLFLAKELGRPVKWVDTRQGLARTTVHSHDHIEYATLAGNRDGKITALYCTNYANLGAFSGTNGPGAPTSLTGRSISGAYAIEHPFYEVYCVFTNTTQTGPIRGAGRTEAHCVIERLVDLFADEIGLDPAEVRRQNMVPPDKFPYKNGLGWTYDSGNYQVALDKALEMVDYKNIPQLKEQAKARGKYLGVGIGSFVAISGVGPSPIMATDIGLNGSTWGSVHLRVHPTGDVSLITGSQPHGQGHVTTFSQVAAQELGIDIERIEVIHSDTRGAIYAQGSYGSRSFSVEGATIYKAAQKINEKARKMAAHIFKVPEDEIIVEDGKFYPKNQPDQVKTIQDIALALWYAWDLPPGMEPGLEVITFFDPPDFSYPFGTHIAVVEVDQETGEVEVVRYVAVNDFGNVGNPMIVDGQTHGNIYLGISQALFEEAVYDESGKILTDDLTSYAIAKPSDLPHFELARTVTPTPHNPLGAKGAGDVSNPPVAPAIVNAVCDALSPLGVKHLNMPLTPEKVWRAMNGV